MAYMQDIHLQDVEHLYNFRDYWANQEYGNAIEYLQDNQSDLVTKYLDPEYFNDLTDWIVDLENNTSQPKEGVIKVSATPPAGLQSGQVYFQLV